MTPPPATGSVRRASPGWPGVVAAGLLVVLVIAAAVLVVRGNVPLAPGEPVQVDITLPEPVLPDGPRLPERPVVPPVDPRVASGTAVASPD